MSTTEPDANVRGRLRDELHCVWTSSAAGAAGRMARSCSWGGEGVAEKWVAARRGQAEAQQQNSYLTYSAESCDFLQQPPVAIQWKHENNLS